jgi:hypothetical protein
VPRCAAPSRAALAEAGPASAGRARVAVGRAPQIDFFYFLILFKFVQIQKFV